MVIVQSTFWQKPISFDPLNSIRTFYFVINFFLFDRLFLFQMRLLKMKVALENYLTLDQIQKRLIYKVKEVKVFERS